LAALDSHQQRAGNGRGGERLERCPARSEKTLNIRAEEKGLNYAHNGRIEDIFGAGEKFAGKMRPNRLASIYFPPMGEPRKYWWCSRVGSVTPSWPPRRSAPCASYIRGRIAYLMKRYVKPLYTGTPWAIG